MNEVSSVPENVAGNTYDKYASTNPVEKRMMAGFFDALDECLAGLRPQRVVEVGAGEGRITERLVERFPDADVIGLDLLDGDLAGEWERLGLPMFFGDATRLPFPDDSIDLVVGLEMLEHVPSPDRALSEIARVCRGTVVFSVPREPIWRAGNIARGRYLHELGNTPGHVNHWSARGFRKFVGRRFTVERVARPLPWTMVRATPHQGRSATDVDATIDATLDELDDAHNYRDWILSLARPHLAGRVLEVGAGRGTFTADLDTGDGVTAVEPSPSGCSILRERMSGHADVEVVEGTLDAVDRDRAFGSAVMFNVLEHIDDDDAALVDIRRRLVPGGELSLWVPAFDLLFSRFDRELGHHRRYRLEELQAKVEGAGYEVVEARYVNAPGFFSWLILVRLLRLRPATGPLVRAFDRFVVPVVRRVERRFRMPFGQSIFLVGRRPAP